MVATCHQIQLDESDGKDATRTALKSGKERPAHLPSSHLGPAFDHCAVNCPRLDAPPEIGPEICGSRSGEAEGQAGKGPGPWTESGRWNSGPREEGPFSVRDETFIAFSPQFTRKDGGGGGRGRTMI